MGGVDGLFLWPTLGGYMFSQIELAVHRAKLTHAVASQQEQQRQLAALQALVLGLLGLGSSAGAGAIPGALGDGRQN